MGAIQRDTLLLLEDDKDNYTARVSSAFGDLLKLCDDKDLTKPAIQSSISFGNGKQACLRSILSLLPSHILGLCLRHSSLGDFDSGGIGQFDRIWPGPIDLIAEDMAKFMNLDDNATIFLGNVTESDCLLEGINHKLLTSTLYNPVYFVGYLLSGRQWYAFRFYYNTKSMETYVSVSDSLLDCRRQQRPPQKGNKNRYQMELGSSIQQHLIKIHQELLSFYNMNMTDLKIVMSPCPQQEYDSNDSGVIMLHCLETLLGCQYWTSASHSTFKNQPMSKIADGNELRLNAIKVLCSLGHKEQDTMTWGNLFSITLKDQEVQSSRGSYIKDSTWVPSQALDKPSLPLVIHPCGSSCTQSLHKSNDTTYTYNDWFLDGSSDSDPSEDSLSEVTSLDDDSSERCSSEHDLTGNPFDCTGLPPKAWPLSTATQKIQKFHRRQPSRMKCTLPS